MSMSSAPPIPKGAPPAPSRAAPASSMTLSQVRTGGRKLPLRILYHAVPGFGKTSFAAQFPSPIFLLDRGETGLETLIDAGQIGEIPHFPEVQTWNDVLQAVELLINDEHDYKTLVLDTLGGVERLAHEHVCNRDFSGNWGEDGFLSYHKGYEIALSDWRALLSRLDELRSNRRMRIVGLCHTKIQTFQNPEGPDYDRYEPDMHRKTWGLTHKWADMVLFGNYFTVTKGPEKRKTKAKGGTRRMLYSERTAAWDAKNRHGLPAEIELGNSPNEAYQAFVNAMNSNTQSNT